MKKRLPAIILICVLMLTACGAEVDPSSETASVPPETSAPETEKTETEAPAKPTQEPETQTERAAETETTVEMATTRTAESEKETKKSGVSKYYSEEDIEQAKDAVREWTSSLFEGSTIKELYYPGDDFTEDYQAQSQSGGGAFQSTDHNMVLGGYFIQDDGTERGTSGYPLWVWILKRSTDGWSVVDAGY